MSKNRVVPGRPPMHARTGEDYAAKYRAENPLYQKTQPITQKFERERCEYSARQMDDLNKTEAQRRYESMRTQQAVKAQSHGSRMVQQDQPAPRPRPSPGMAYAADRAAHFARMDAERKSAHARNEAMKLKSQTQTFNAQTHADFKAKRRDQSISITRSQTREQ